MADSHAAVAAELRVAYDALAAAMRAKEIAAFMALHSPEFVFEEEAHRVTRSRWEADYTSAFANIEAYGPVAFAIEGLTVVGETAVADVHHRLFTTWKKAKQERFDEQRTRDTWTRTPDGWLLTRREEQGGGVFGHVEREEPEIESPRLAALAAKLQVGDGAALAEFWSATEAQAPLVEPVPDDERHRWVTVLWRGNDATRGVELQGGIPTRAPKPLARLPNTDLWFRTERLPTDTRFSYRLAVKQPLARPSEGEGAPTDVIAVASQPDPRNARIIRGESVLELPDAPPRPWIERRPDVPAGEVRDERLQSEILKEERAVTLYTPPGYDPNGALCDLLVLFDGEVAQSLVPVPTVLDNLIAEKRLAPMVAVLVHCQTTRIRDLGCSAPFAEFLADELVPWIRARYRVTTDPRRTIVSGISLGGSMAVFVGFRHSSVFGNVHSQSGSFWYYDGWPEKTRDYATEHNWLARQFVATPRLPLRFYLEVGYFEGLVPENCHLRDVLGAKGYPITYTEFSGGHDYLTWGGTLADGLLALAAPWDDGTD